MKQQIISNLENPRQLERLYRENKASFKKEFNVIYPGIQDKSAAQIWHERLNFEEEDILWGSKEDLVFVVVASLIAGLVAKIPMLTSINENFYYPRNIAFIVFPFLAAFFAWKQKISINKLLIAGAAFAVSLVYINLLPANHNSNTLILACIHLPLFLWAVTGFVYAGGATNDLQKRISFLQYNGDLLVITALIVIAGGILTVITLGMFKLIGLHIEKFYFDNVVILGAAASPIVGTYLVRTNPQLVGRVSPVIAKVFTPLVLVTLVIYLVAVIATGKDPYNDREFLLLFNLLLIGVMAIIFFSIAETSKHSQNRTSSVMLLALSVVTIIVNGIALSAIIYRLAEFGITPNRLAVLGGNILMLTNLVIVTIRLFKSLNHRNQIENVEESIASFLPFYAAWTMIVVFLFPVFFSFR